MPPRSPEDSETPLFANCKVKTEVQDLGGDSISSLWERPSQPGHPKVCFMKVFRYIKPTKKHSFGDPGTNIFGKTLETTIQRCIFDANYHQWQWVKQKSSGTVPFWGWPSPYHPQNTGVLTHSRIEPFVFTCFHPLLSALAPIRSCGVTS